MAGRGGESTKEKTNKVAEGGIPGRQETPPEEQTHSPHSRPALGNGLAEICPPEPRMACIRPPLAMHTMEDATSEGLLCLPGLFAPNA